jgi:hypothetical protein
VHQGVDDVVEHHPIRNPPAMAAQRMIRVELRWLPSAMVV